MIKYANKGRNSGIESYETGDNYILIKFYKKQNSKTQKPYYLYDYETTGKAHVENMKTLAKNGKGLNSYIMKNLNNIYHLSFAKKPQIHEKNPNITQLPSMNDLESKYLNLLKQNYGKEDEYTIGEKLELSSHQVSTILDSLENKGLIEKVSFGLCSYQPINH